MKALLCVLAAIVVIYFAACFAMHLDPMALIQSFTQAAKAAGMLVSLR